MAIDSEDIDSVAIDSVPIDAEGAGGDLFENNALNITDDIDSTQVFGGETWNLLSNAAHTQSTILNPSGVATGWSITNTTYSENGLNLATLPFYDAGVYGIDRFLRGSGANEIFTIGGLDNARFYTFIISGATTENTGTNTRVLTMTSNVSAETAVILTDASETDDDHIDQIDLQSPSGGQIVLTLTASGGQTSYLSTFEIQEFL